MKNWSTDKIIGSGLILALYISIIALIIITIFLGKMPGTDLPMAIVTGLAGYMGRNSISHIKEDEVKNNGKGN